jgi:general secretion pathway protein D
MLGFAPALFGQLTIGLPTELRAPAVFGSITPEELEEARRPLPPAELKAKAGEQDFDITGDSKALFERVPEAFGLRVVFDKDYQAAQNVRFRVKKLAYRDALRALEAATDSFITPLSDQLIFVARDNPQKRQEYARTVSVAIPIPDPVTPQDMQEIANTVRAITEIRRLIVDVNKHMILMRDVVGRVRSAQIMVERLMHPAPQVMVEVDLMAVTSTSQLHYGIALPTEFPLVAFGSAKHGNILASAITTGMGYLGFGGGLGFIGIGLTETSIFASVSKSFATTLNEAQLLASQGQPATLKFGTKYPIASNEYVGSNTTGGQVYSPPPTVTFEDLGLVIKILPHVHGLNEVTLDIEASFKLLAGSGLNGIPIISNREYKGSVRLMDGQSAVLTGMMSATEARTITGIAGLTSVPLIGKLLSENKIEKDRDETLIVIKPRLVIPPAGEFDSKPFWVGTESRPAEVL